MHWHRRQKAKTNPLPTNRFPSRPHSTRQLAARATASSPYHSPIPAPYVPSCPAARVRTPTFLSFPHLIPSYSLAHSPRLSFPTLRFPSSAITMNPEKYSYSHQAFPSSLDPCFVYTAASHPPPSYSLPPFPHHPQLPPPAFADHVPTSLPKSYDFPADPSLFLDFFSSPLPALCSMEHPRHSSESSSAPKRVRFQSPLGSTSSSGRTKHPKEASRRGRQKFGERTRCLQKLLPWTKKMDIATVLEEAHRYVCFLQSQVAVLQAMPISSSFGQLSNVGSGLGPLGMLNRQQLLQVVLNSPVAQTVLSELGLCVFAYEQLVMLRKAAALPLSSFTLRG